MVFCYTANHNYTQICTYNTSHIHVFGLEGVVVVVVGELLLFVTAKNHWISNKMLEHFPAL